MNDTRRFYDAVNESRLAMSEIVERQTFDDVQYEIDDVPCDAPTMRDRKAERAALRATFILGFDAMYGAAVRADTDADVRKALADVREDYLALWAAALKLEHRPMTPDGRRWEDAYWRLDRSLLHDLRPFVLTDWTPAASPSGLQGQPGNETDSRVAKLLAGDMSSEVADIVSNSSLSTDEKMRKIGVIRNETVHWNAVRWSELLGCDPSWIRKQPTWKNWRAAERKSD